MSEMPERKVLKEVLASLKSKTISSNQTRKTNVASIHQELAGAKQKLLELVKERSSEPIILWLMTLYQRTASMVHQLVSESDSTIGDMEIYIDALERYSINLDKTLSEIFEQAKKQAEEQIKQQEELMKKESTEYIK